MVLESNARTGLPVVIRLKSPSYDGSGTLEDPYIVAWHARDPQNPYNWSKGKKWFITAQLAIGTLCVTFASTLYTGSISAIKVDLHMSQVQTILPITLYILGFAFGPLIFAPLSEIYGRRLVMLWTFVPFVMSNVACALAPNTTVLAVFRLLAGTFGSSPLANAGGSVSDMWAPHERSLATSLYSAGPWFGPIFGPLVGGVIMDSTLGWRFDFWLIVILAGTLTTLAFFAMPETYAPVLLQRRAKALQDETDGQRRFISKYDLNRTASLSTTLRDGLRRPFVYLFLEPIVACFAIYIALIYAVLYSYLIAYPIIFQEHRGWSAMQTGLALLSIGVGNVLAHFFTSWGDRIYKRSAAKSETGRAAPETRLVTGMIGAPLIAISCFWFAWTTQPSIYWLVPVASGVPFGLGMLLVFTSVISYTMDTYRHLCASALAAIVVLRSALAAIFPLFTEKMFQSLGDQWGLTVFAILSLVCAPFPFLFYALGKRIRAASHFASEFEKKETTV